MLRPARSAQKRVYRFPLRSPYNVHLGFDCYPLLSVRHISMIQYAVNVAHCFRYIWLPGAQYP